MNSLAPLRRLLVTGTSSLKMRAYTHRLLDRDEGIPVAARKQGLSLAALSPDAVTFIEPDKVPAAFARAPEHTAVLASLETPNPIELIKSISPWTQLPLNAQNAQIILPKAHFQSALSAVPALSASLLPSEDETEFPVLRQLAYRMMFDAAKPQRATEQIETSVAFGAKVTRDMSRFAPLLTSLMQHPTIVAGAVIDSRCGSLLGRQKENQLPDTFGTGMNGLFAGAQQLGLGQLDEVILSYPNHYFICSPLPHEPKVLCGIVVDKVNGLPAMEKMKLRKALEELPVLAS